jgi:hypothetical protein
VTAWVFGPWHALGGRRCWKRMDPIRCLILMGCTLHWTGAACLSPIQSSRIHSAMIVRLASASSVHGPFSELLSTNAVMHSCTKKSLRRLPRPPRPIPVDAKLAPPIAIHLAWRRFMHAEKSSASPTTREVREVLARLQAEDERHIRQRGVPLVPGLRSSTALLTVQKTMCLEADSYEGLAIPRLEHAFLSESDYGLGVETMSNGDMPYGNYAWANKETKALCPSHLSYLKERQRGPLLGPVSNLVYPHRA